MLRALLISLVLAAPAFAGSTCGGENLFETMPPEDAAALEAAAAAEPYASGLLWQAAKGERTITVFGSYHLPHAFTEAHLERLLPIAAEADVTYFEMNANDLRRFETDMAQSPDLMFLNEGPTLPSLLTPTEWRKVSAGMQARGFPSFMTAKMKPIFVSMMLGMSPCMFRQVQSGEKGIDHALAHALEEEGLPTRSIEDYRTAAKLFDAFDPETQMDLLRLSLTQDIDPDDLMETLYQSYISEEVAKIWAFTKQLSLETGGEDAEAHFAVFEKLLLTDRNSAWLGELAGAPEQKVLVVVGAAHLPGANGVLQGLSEAGYTLTRLSLK